MTVDADLDALVRRPIRGLAPYAPGEQVAQCTKMNTNECAWGPAPAVQTVLADLTEDALRLYPQPMADDLRQVASEVFKVSPDRILAGNGSDDCLTILFRTHLQPGDQFACPWPTYSLYDTLAGLQDVEPLHIDYTDWRDGEWGLPTALATTGAPVTIVANPNNPSATLIATNELRRLANQVTGILVVDEAYVDFADAEIGNASMLAFLDDHPNLVVLRTFSKSYSLAGARLGLMFAHPRLIQHYVKVKDSYNVNVLTQLLGIAALRDRDYHRDLVANTLAERAFLEDQLAAFGWTWPTSRGNFLLCRVGEQARSLYLGLKDRGILVRFFDKPGLDSCLRISVGQRADNQALIAALRDLGA